MDYYQKIVQIAPATAEAQGILGFCYQVLGQQETAKIFYQKALVLRPQFFWFNYNLALLYAQDKEYLKAIELLKPVLSVKINDHLEFIYGSGIYRQIFSRQPGLGKYIFNSLENGYQNAVLLLAFCHKELTGEDVQIPKELFPGVDVEKLGPIEVRPKLL